MSEASLPRILRKRGEPEYPTFVELFFDLAYIFIFRRLTESLLGDDSLRGVAQTAVLLLAGWWVWVLTAWLTDLFNPQLAIIQNLVLAVTVGVIVMATSMPRAFQGRGLIFVLAYFAIHLARDAVLIPGTRANRDIQARSVRVFFWLGVSAVPWLIGAFAGGLAQLALWALAVAIDYGSARIGWPTPRLGRTDLASQIFTAPHLAERHRQIVIVALGELILTASIGLSSGDFGPSQIAVFALSLGSAILLYRLYSQQVRRLLAPRAAEQVEHIRVGTFASYWHLLMAAGVVCVSVGARTIDARPFAQVSVTRTLVILAGPALFLVGSCLFDWSVHGRFLRVRIFAALAAFAVTPVVYPLPAFVIMCTVDAILLLTLSVEVLMSRRPSGRARTRVR